MCSLTAQQIFQHRRSRFHLLDRPPRHARSPYSRSTAFRELGHRWSTRDCVRLQSARPLDHETATTRLARSTGRSMALLPLHGYRNICWNCDGSRLRMVVHHVQEWAADIGLSARKLRPLAMNPADLCRLISINAQAYFLKLAVQCLRTPRQNVRRPCPFRYWWSSRCSTH